VLITALESPERDAFEQTIATRAGAWAVEDDHLRRALPRGADYMAAPAGARVELEALYAAQTETAISVNKQRKTN